MIDYTRTKILPKQRQALCALLHTLGYDAGMDGLYWLPVPPEDLSPLQREHLATCGPYALAVEVEKDRLSMEFLVRARNTLCCDCIHPASPQVAAHMQASLEALLACAGISPDHS
ncbi:MAG: hypothetical protein RRY29_09475 [Desulfovibrionaceae bacterium]